MNIIPIEKAKKLNTKRLLSYFKKVRNQMFSLGNCSCGCGCFITEIYEDDDDQVQKYYEIEKHYEKLKKILNGREHIERKNRRKK